MCNIQKLSFVGVLLFFLISLVFPAMAEVQSVAKELSKNLPKNISIAIQPIDRSTANLSSRSSKALLERFTNAIQMSIQDSGSTLIDRSKLDAIMMEQEEFQDIEEFSNLIANTGADALLSLSVLRVDKETIEVAGRAFGVKGDLTGKVLAASNSYEISSPSTYIIKVNSIKQGSKDRKKYLSSIIDGLSSYKEIEIANDTIPDYQLDFKMDIKIEFESAEVATEESKKAEESAKGFKIFDDLVSGMGIETKSGKNPLGNLTSMAPDSDALKKLVFISNVEAIIVNLQSDGILGSTANAEASVEVTASDKEKKRAAQQSIREALNTLGIEAGAKITGNTPPSSDDPSSLLD